MIIDAHIHLWERQQGLVDGKPVFPTEGGKSNFGGEERQMVPPYITDGFNSAELLISNMNYAGVNACVVTQEYIDGNQDVYLKKSKAKYPERIKICSLYEENEEYGLDGFDGLKICGGRLERKTLGELKDVFYQADRKNKFISIDLAEGSKQVPELEDLICRFPNLRIAIGHFGMVTKEGWKEQIRLARYPNVYIESGGITWLFHKEYYPYPSAVNAIREATEICGIEKLMWGSDYPRTMTAITYKMSYDFIEKSNKLTRYEKEQFLYHNAKKFYGFSEFLQLPYIKNMVEDK